MLSRPRRRNNKSSRKQRKSTNSSNSSHLPGVRVPREISMSGIPPTMKVMLKLIDEGVLNTGVTQCVRYNPNDLYTPITGGSSGIVPYFTPLSAMYGFYRVLGYRYTVTFSNLVASPVSVYILNYNNDPGTTASPQRAADPLSQYKQLAGKGGMDRCTFTKRLPMSAVVGSKATDIDSDYRALINADPADPNWLGICAHGINSVSLAAGVMYSVVLEFDTLFYSRLQQ